jgi:hypothetical protein
MVAQYFTRAIFVFFSICVFGLTGCAQPIEPWVKPYERQHLADPIMRTNRHPIANMHVAHVYEARESARGTDGTGGGGCGCN